MLFFFSILIIFTGAFANIECDSSSHPYNDNSEKNCRKTIGNGLSKTRRIYGGEEARPHEFPMMAALYMDHQVFCGATIISDRYALTAAHCLYVAAKNYFTPGLLVGAHWLDRGEAISGTILEVNYVKAHPGFKGYIENFMEFDIGIVGVKSPIQFSNQVSPVCLPFFDKKRDNFYNETVISLGWGVTRERVWTDWLYSLKSDVLLKMEHYVESDARCKGKSKSYRVGQHLCTQFSNRTTCEGDSGGPVLWKDPQTGLWKLLGIHIGGRLCGDANVKKMNSLNIRVIYFLDWIEETLSDVEFCKVE